MLTSPEGETDDLLEELTVSTSEDDIDRQARDDSKNPCCVGPKAKNSWLEDIRRRCQKKNPESPKGSWKEIPKEPFQAIIKEVLGEEAVQEYRDNGNRNSCVQENQHSELY